MIKVTLQDYENRHNNKFPNNPIKVIEKIKRQVYFDTEFGICKKGESSFGCSNYSIESAVNKTNYLKRQLFKIYGNKYNYSKVIFKKTTRDKITFFCNKHKIEFTKFIDLNNPIKNCCFLCHKENNVKTLTKEQFIEKSNTIHNFKYNYDLVNYIKGSEKVVVICSKHGKFEQNAKTHLRGSGCFKCGREKIKDSNSKNPTGWTTTSWKNAANKSKNFDSFKVYIIECWNKKEHFYKIGRTYLKIEKRFQCKERMPYKYKVMKVFEGTLEDMYNLETNLKKLNKQYKYLPKIKFGGMYECFTKINKINERN